MKKILFGLVASTFSLGAIASTVGISNHPFLMKKHIFNTEYNNYFNDGAGSGLNVMYHQRYNSQLNFDAGFGFTNGDRESRAFVGANMQLIPDYGRQPRVSLKGTAETENLDGDRINTFGVAPTISKGFVMWGNEAFPFISLPLKVSLNENEKEYETSTAVALGMTGRLPFESTRNLVGNIEANFSLRNSYASLVMGVSLPIE
ncbi:MAG: hypothetical protein QF441_00790 [Bacteriovoracaceae bacterium]|jgi:hypothetical protein|nr:hypothetical protein [Halobacteriovoraceae bacterium]MDP7319105.1 hypothetical protein [Bacteriovoracaceae bacterium]